MTAPANLDGLRVLVVEDDMLIALHIEDTLQGLGCIVVGPVGRLEAAMQMAAGETLDAAILDVNIRGGHVYPVADRLCERGIPFLLASGYGDWSLPQAYRDHTRLTKPFTTWEIEAQLQLLCSGPGRPH